MSKPNLQPGDIVDGRYRVLEILGQGGFAFVYVAERLADGTEVVVKSLHHLAARHDSTAYERFRREARIAADLVHPNIVRTIDYGVMSNGKLYLVMEKIPGRPLDQVMKEDGAIPLDGVATILEQIVSALAKAHRHSIVHRDLKPTNVLLEGDAHTGVIKIIDFGLAKVLEGTDPTIMETLTKMGTIVGTPGYLAPEVLYGEAVTPAADIYAAGVMAHELCVGRLSYTGKALERVQAQAKRNPDPPPEHIRSHPVYAVIERLMARDLAERYPTADEALADLHAIKNVPEPPQTAPEPRRERSHRKKAWWRFWE